ncbi:MAG: hypothetical protein HY560_09255, partial [Gemmatimonadetes bacterium]|nr:hypothetical protein [Gemmatimonadota bacterium]
VALGRRAREVAARVVVAGVGEPAEGRPERWRLDADGRATLTFRGRAIRLPLIGAHQAANAMLALALASELGLDLAAVSAALGSVRLPPGRGEVLQSGRLTVINDAYNANPRSLGAALETARAIRAGRRLVVAVGTMLELGAESRRQHERMADAILALQPDLIAAVGEFAEVLAARRPALGERLLTAADPDELGRRLAARLQGDELVLVKASRGVRLERAIPHLLPSSEASCSTTT